jgi:hypothetical protein
VPEDIGLDADLARKNETLELTIRHLREELNEKSDIIRRQDTELNSLRTEVIKL